MALHADVGDLKAGDFDCGSPSNAPPLIEARNISKAFAAPHGEVVALRDVSFDIQRGEFVSIVGQSGCGKSTLMRIIAGLIPRSAGSLTMDGRQIDGPTGECAIVFQAPVLLPWRNTLDNILLPLEFRGVRRAGDVARARDLLQTVGLKDFANAHPYELSGGMQQRVAIARALIQDPQLILMDEPFGALDAMSREQMNQELLRIWTLAGNTVIFITHSVAEAVLLSDRVIAMSARPGTIAEIIEISLPRPRDLSVINTPEFGAYTQRLRRLLNAEGTMF